MNDESWRVRVEDERLGGAIEGRLTRLQRSSPLCSVRLHPPSVDASPCLAMLARGNLTGHQRSSAPVEAFIAAPYRAEAGNLGKQSFRPYPHGGGRAAPGSADGSIYI